MFRQDALENRKMKWQGRAILLPGIPLWLIMLGSIMFITAFLMFIIVGTYSRRVNVSGEVTTWPRAVRLAHPTSQVPTKPRLLLHQNRS